MHRLLSLTKLLILIVLVNIGCLVVGQTPSGSGVEAGPLTPPPQTVSDNTKAVGEYIAGIDALDSGDYSAAVTALNRALEGDADNPDYVRARGVANTLAENFPSALTDLQRAMKLRGGNDREAQLWLAAAYRMNADWEKGSLNYTHGGDVPNDYANLVYNIVANDYAMSRYRHTYFDRDSHKQVATDQIIKTHFLDAAKIYAQQHKAQGPVAAAALVERVKANIAKQDWAPALHDLQVLRQQAPDDNAIRSYWAVALVGAGDGLQARQEFTHALSIDPTWADGYLGRARAAAMIGDPRRANADLDAAAEAGASDIAPARAEVTRLPAQSPPEDAPDRFTKAVNSDASFGDLVDAALDLHRWTNARRSRYDEAYQDRIHVLTMAEKSEPANAGAPDLLGWFLYTSCNVPMVWDGPRSDARQVRPQSPAERTSELRRAIADAQASFKLDPNRAGALGTEGWALYVLGQRGESEAVADQGLKIEPQNVPLIDLKMQLLNNAAAELASHAAALRQPQSETHTELRSDGEYRITTTHPPAESALAEARELEAKAAALRQQAADLHTRADKVKNELVPGLMKQSDEALKAGNAAASRKNLQQVYAHWPSASGLFAKLAQACHQQGDARWERIYGLLGEPMLETTAASDLKAAWDAISKTSWLAARDSLDRAASLDPSDARVPAYRSILDTAKDPTELATFNRDCHAAIALEEARARQLGTTFNGKVGESQNVDLLTSADAALTLLLRNHLGDALAANGDNKGAIEAYLPNLSLEERLGPSHLSHLLPGIVLPDPTANGIGEIPTLASILSSTRLGMANAFLAMGKSVDASEQFRKVHAYRSNWPAATPGRESLNVTDTWAQVGLAEAAYKARDYETAYTMMFSGGGFPGNLPPPLTQKIKQLSDNIFAARQQGAQQQFDATARMTPQQRKIQSLQYDLQQMHQQRDNLAKAKDDSATTSQAKTAIENSISQLDQIIAQRKEELEKSQGSSPNK